ncbi:ATP--guanido phosphotransferase [Spirochaeta thermophila]|uniref:Phosphagen kinase C-terminal domain-containing protein n=1 Tax=Winmispira thermophila (strain ATCC 49972 / DSM 6192 / RI 19.B1) TaxID=665571 RepID=E0RT43_WINT6|nr:ATP--guanido phosphotransferase [Spirochaeta thermophila]ADN02180.1 hypothetical protein STHERM_c12390 [Spirochaeta thermophila DSM 6192]
MNPYTIPSLSWFNRTHEPHEVVVSTRVRLSRNVAGYPFPGMLGTRVQQELVERIVSAWSHYLPGTRWVDLKSLPATAKKQLIESQVLTRQDLMAFPGGSLLLSPDTDPLGLVCFSDHLRLVRYDPGYNVQQGMDSVRQLAEKLDEKLPFAFSLELGYLNANVQDVGTGYRVSLLLHTPATFAERAVVMLKKLLSEHDAVFLPFQSGRDLYSQGMFLLMMDGVQGLPPEKVRKRLEDTCTMVIHYEREKRETLLSSRTRREEVRERIDTAWKILTSSRKVSSKAASEALLLLRTAAVWGVGPRMDLGCFPYLYFASQPGHMRSRMEVEGVSLSREGEEEARAAWLREMLSDHG